MFRHQEIKDLFHRKLRIASRDDLMGHFEETISGYEKELDRRQKLLDVVLQPEIKLQRADVQLLLDPPEQQEWSSSLDQEDPELPHIKEEQEELWSSQEGEQFGGLEEAQITKFSRLQVLTDSFKQKLRTASRDDLMGHFEETISEYEKELDRQQKLLDMVLQPEIKLQRADIQQLSVSEHKGPSEEWSSSLDQEDPELPHIKEEQEELWSSQESEQLGGLEEAQIKFTPVPVKSEEEEDDEEKPQSSQLHQRPTEADGEDCGGPEPARNSDAETHLQPDTEDRTEDSSEEESDGGDRDWRDPDRKLFGCSVCSKTFNHRGNLNIHMRTHTGVKPFSCSLCNKRFTQKAGLNYHLKTHTGERPFSCSMCGKTYRHKGALTYHMATHTGAKPFSCADCGKRFRGMSQLKIHKCIAEKRLHRNDKHKKPLSCSECDATFPNNYLLTTHLRMHRGKKLFTCPFCGKKRQFSSHLEIHMRTHTGEKPYSCSICGKRFSQRGIMNQHMAVHSGVKPFSCSDCGRRFFWQFQVKKHKCLGPSSIQRQGFHGLDGRGSEPGRNWTPERSLKPEDKKGPTLSSEAEDSVDIDFWRKTRKHQSGVTYRRNRKVCISDSGSTDKKLSSCSDDQAKTEPKTNGVNIDMSVQTRRQSGLNYRIQEEFSVSDSGSSADRKPLSFSVRHIRCEDSATHGKHHTGEKPLSYLCCEKKCEKLHSCIICDKTFSSESQLVSHRCVSDISKQHEVQTLIPANRLFVCSQCGRGFSRRHHLQLHTRSHAAEKPFGCSVCGKTFARRETLSFHMSCHTGEKPFHCSVCSTGFIDSESLVKHMRIHTGVTQFSCSVCGKEFTWRRYLTKHMEVHAKQKLHSCRVCNREFTQLYHLRDHQCAGDRAEEDRDAEHLSSGSAEQREADGENCGGPGSTRNSDPDPHSQGGSDDKTVDSSESQAKVRVDLMEMSESGLNPQRDQTCNSCSEFEETSSTCQPLKIHSREKPFSVTETGSLSRHMFDPTANHRGLKQEDPELPHIKEEQEALWSSQESEQLGGLEEAQIKFTPVPVKSEEEEDDEEKPQSSQLHQRPTEADGEDRGGPEPARNSDPDVQPVSEDSVDSDFWKETRERPSAPDSFKDDEICENVFSEENVLSSAEKASERQNRESDESTDSDVWKDNDKPEETDGKPHRCSECGKRFLHLHHMKNHRKRHQGKKEAFVCSVCGQTCPYMSHLKIHMRTHTGEKPFVCPVCGKKYAHKASMQSHMSVHAVEKQYTCSACDSGFAWFTELKYHQCAGRMAGGESTSLP